MGNAQRDKHHQKTAAYFDTVTQSVDVRDIALLHVIHWNLAVRDGLDSSCAEIDAASDGVAAHGPQDGIVHLLTVQVQQNERQESAASNQG